MDPNGKHPASRRVEDLGITQRDLATATGCSQTSVALQLSGHRTFSGQLEAALRGYLIGSRTTVDPAGEAASVRRDAESTPRQAKPGGT